MAHDKEYMRKYMARYRLEHPERLWCNKNPDENKAARRLNHIKHKAKHNVRCCEYNRKHPDKIRQLVREWQQTHKTMVKLAHRKYHQSSLGMIHHKLAKAKRRELERGIGKAYTLKEWKEKLEATGGLCPGFGCPPHFVGVGSLTLDHIIPIAKAPKGFVYTIKDISPLCKSCNTRKSSLII